VFGKPRYSPANVSGVDSGELTFGGNSGVFRIAPWTYYEILVPKISI